MSLIILGGLVTSMALCRKMWTQKKHLPVREKFQVKLELCMRELEEGDFNKCIIPLLAQLTKVGKITQGFFRERVNVFNCDRLQRIVVVEDVRRKQIVACGTLCIEPKFIHQAGFAGHLEDVVVDSSYRSKGLGTRIVCALIGLARDYGCYKVILDCKEKNVPFYKQIGFKRKEVQMAAYFPETQTPDEIPLQGLQTKVESLGDDLVIRQLCADDYGEGFLALLAQLTTVGNVNKEFFNKRLAMLKASNRELMYVIEDVAQHRIVATGSLLVEYKFIHSAGKCGHIEDVVVDRNSRGRGLGKKIVKKLREVAMSLGCYKCILDCAESNVRFYEKCGFKRNEICMAMYLDKTH